MGEHAGLYALDTRGPVNIEKYGIFSREISESTIRAELAGAGLPENINISNEGIVICGGPIRFC